MDDLKQELRNFEGSDALGAGDFSVCIRGADRIEAQDDRIAELEAALSSIARNTCCDKCQEAALVASAALAGGKATSDN